VHALVLYPVAVPVPQGAEQSLFQVTSENEVQPPLTVGENGLVKFTCIVCQFNGLVKFTCIVCQFNGLVKFTCIVCQFNGLVNFTCIVCHFNCLVKFICIVCQIKQNSILPYLSLFHLIRLVYRQRLFLKK
jgi:hypothetical protein